MGEDEDTVRELRDWAAGSYAAEAAVEMLARAFGGRFAAPGWPWIVPPAQDRGGDTRTGRHWLDAAALGDGACTGVLSSGERTYLRFAAAMIGPTRVDLSNLAGLDRDLQALVLAGLSHAGGAHKHPATATVRHTDALPGQTFTAQMPVPGQDADPLFPWPDDDVPGNAPGRRDPGGPTPAPYGEGGRTPRGRGAVHQEREVPHSSTGHPVDR